MKRNHRLDFDCLENHISLSTLTAPPVDDSEFDNPVPPLVVNPTMFVPPVGLIPISIPGPSPTPIYIGPLPAVPLSPPDIGDGSYIPPDNLLLSS